MLPSGYSRRRDCTDEHIAENATCIAGNEGEHAHTEHVQPMPYPDGGAARCEYGSARQIECHQESDALHACGTHYARAADAVGNSRHVPLH
jgi:hypothetical protein